MRFVDPNQTNFASCPEDYAIAEVVTGKDGLFWIYAIAKVWDESDNLGKIHAEFGGDENFLSSSSQAFPIVVYPSNAEKCTN